MKSIISSTVLAFAAEAAKTEEVRPGVFRMPLERVSKQDLGHPSAHPMVGNWTDAEMWESEVKLPVAMLDDYLYVSDCNIGTDQYTWIRGE